MGKKYQNHQSSRKQTVEWKSYLHDSIEEGRKQAYYHVKQSHRAKFVSVDVDNNIRDTLFETREEIHQYSTPSAENRPIYKHNFEWKAFVDDVLNSNQYDMSSLQLKCLDMIARNLHNYSDYNVLSDYFNSLPPMYVEVLSCLATKYNNITKENFVIFVQSHISHLYFGHQVKNDSINILDIFKYVTPYVFQPPNDIIKTFEIPDNWEDTLQEDDIESSKNVIHTTITPPALSNSNLEWGVMHGCKSLTHIYLLYPNITSDYMHHFLCALLTPDVMHCDSTTTNTAQSQCHHQNLNCQENTLQSNATFLHCRIQYVSFLKSSMNEKLLHRVSPFNIDLLRQGELRTSKEVKCRCALCTYRDYDYDGDDNIMRHTSDNNNGSTFKDTAIADMATNGMLRLRAHRRMRLTLRNELVTLSLNDLIRIVSI